MLPCPFCEQTTLFLKMHINIFAVGSTNRLSWILVPIFYNHVQHVDTIMQMKINNKFKISGSLLSKLYTEVTDNPYQGILLSDLLVDHLTLIPVAL